MSRVWQAPGSKRRHNLVGKVFGPLKVVRRWGAQSGNAVWVVFCLHCGYVNKRLGTHLVNGVRVWCSGCKVSKRWSVSSRKRPDLGRVAAVMQSSPDWKAANAATVDGLRTRARSFTEVQLTDMADTISSELARRNDDT